MFKKEKDKKGAGCQEVNNVRNRFAESEGSVKADVSNDNVSVDADNVSEGAGSEQDALTLALAEATGWKDKYVRLQAEFDNYRKRTLKEKMDLVASGGEDVIKSLLGVMDDLDRALNAVRTASDVEALRAGVEMIDAKFREVLRSKGVEEIEAVGKEFDVDLHEAIAKIPAPTPDMSGKIIDVVQKGYKLKDKVVRYAKVVVGE